MSRLLIIDGYRAELEQLTKVLTTAGFEVDTALTAAGGIHTALVEDFDLILLELALPDGSGEHVLHTVLNRRPGTQIIVVSEVDEVGRRVGVFEMGAVDFVGKPFPDMELLARIRARLRPSYAAVGHDADQPAADSVTDEPRASNHAEEIPQLRDHALARTQRTSLELINSTPASGNAGALRATPPALPHAYGSRPPAAIAAPALAHRDELKLDVMRRSVVVKGRAVELSQREFVLMSHLLRRRGQVCTRRELLAGVWGVDFNARTNVVDVYIRRLRLKLSSDTIDTVHKVGYRLNAS